MSNFSHAGVSKLNGEFKVRFCNDAMRVKVLAKNGHKDIDIIELKTPMSKVEIVEYLLSIDFDNGNKEVRAALEQALDKRSAPKAPTMVVAKTKAPAKSKPSMDAIKAKASAKVKAVANAALEDAPY
jgi:hypothetical protein